MHDRDNLPHARLFRGIRAILTLFALALLTTGAYAQGGSNLRMLYPTGGETFLIDSTVKVYWTVPTTGVTGTLHLELSVDSMKTWTEIGAPEAAPGIDSMAWKVPNQPTTKAFMRIRNADSSKIGRTQRSFSIASKLPSTLRVLAPRGGEIYTWDSTVQIRWSAQNVTGELNVKLSIDSGATWTLIKSVTARAGTDSLTWVVPHETTTKGMIRVATADDSTAANSRLFSIQGDINPAIHLIYPNGGEMFYADSTEIIRWTAKDMSGQLQVQYSNDSGKTWKAIGGPRPARNGNDSVAWKVPNDTTKLALVRVGNATARDTSDNVFTINGRSTVPVASLTLTYPNGGEKLHADSTVKIRWQSANVTGTLAILFSGDNGTTWTYVDTLTARAGRDSISWKVPNSPTTTALIAIGTFDGSVRDTSNADFTILPAGTAGVTAPEIDAATGMRLLGIYPNPSTAGTATLRWEQSFSGDVTIHLYAADGTLVRSVSAGHQEAGAHRISIDVETLPAGTYLYELEMGGVRGVGRMTVVR
jgi:hypothetical protein